MTQLRDDILSKYGVSSGNSGKTTQSTQSTSLRESILAKYTDEAVQKKKDDEEEGKQRIADLVDPAPYRIDRVKELEEAKASREQTISAAPEKGFFEKAFGLAKTGLQKVGILDTEEEKLAKEQAVTILARSLNDRQYLSVGQQLGLDQTIDFEMPEGVNQDDENTVNFYRNKAVVEQVKDNYPQLQQTFGLKEPDQVDYDFVEKHFDDITKELGVRSTMTNEEYAGLMLTLGIGAGTAVPIALGARFLPTIVRTGLGLAGFETINAAERKINKMITGNEESFSQTAIREMDLGESGELLVTIADLFAKGKVLHSINKKAPSVAESLTKEFVTKYNLPKEVKISAEKIKDIFQTGEKISAQELQLVKDLGLDAAGYRQAIKEGVTISVPAEKIVTMVDRPYWGKLKSLFKFEPTDRVISRTKAGETKTAPAGYIEGPSGKPVSTATKLPGESSPKVTEALKKPVSSKTLETISEFTPEESAAFGKKLIQRINEEIGTKLIEADVPTPLKGGIKVNELESSDGRPAQFNNQGKIEVFLPNLVQDLKTLSEGGKILAHEGAYSKVYELKEGETMEQLATRYVKDVLVHEKAHEKTMTLEDVTTGRQIQAEINQARASKNEKVLLEAQNKMDAHMKGLEDKALEYEKTNRTNLEKDLFGETGDSTKVQRDIDRAIKGGKEEKVTTTKKKLLKEKIKAQAAGAKAGKAAGREIGREESAKVRKQYQDALKTVRSKRDTVFEKRQTLSRYARAFLPANVQGKFLKAISNVKTEKEFVSVLNRMAKATDLADRSALIKQIDKELKGTVVKKQKGFPKAKFELSAQEKLDRIRANIKGDYLAAQERIAKIVSDFQAKNPEETLPGDLVAEIQMLEMVGVDKMSKLELRSVLRDIQSIKENGRTLRELEWFNRETKIQAARDKISDIVTGGQEPISETKSIKQKEKRTVKGRISEFNKNQTYSWEELLDGLSIRDKTSKPYESFLSRYGTERTNKAFNKQNDGEIKSIEKVNKSLKEVYGLKKNNEIMSLLNDLKKVRDYGKVVHADGVERNLEISRGQAIQMEMWLRDPTLEGSFTEGLKWGEAVIDTMRNEVMKPEDFKMADKLLEFYREYYVDVNKAYINEYGTKLPFNENYSPVTRDVETLIPENVLLAEEGKHYATAKNNSLKGRVKNNVELKTMDAFENAQRHIAKMEHYKAWSEAMFEFRRIFGNKDLRRNILDFHGEVELKILDNFMNDFARDGVSRERVVREIDTIRSNATKALLGLNWKVGAKQLTGVMNYAIELPIKDFTTGISSFWTSPMKKAKFLYKNSSTLRERFGEGFERDIKFALQKDYDKKLAKTKNWDEAMFILIRNADKFTVYQGAWAAYRSKYMEVKKGGGTDAQAKEAGIKYAEDVTNRVQESSRLDTLAPLQRAGSWAKLFTMFQSQPSKYLRIINNAVKNIKAGRGSKAANLKRIAFAWFIVPFIYNTVAEQFVDEEYRSSTGGTIVKTLLGPLSYPLIAGQMFQSLYGWTTGESFNYNPSAVFAFMDDLQKTVQNFSQDDIVEATSYLLDAVGKLRGIPTTIFTRPFRGQLDDEDEESTVGAVAEF